LPRGSPIQISETTSHETSQITRGESAFSRHLKSLRGHRVYLEPLAGNNGDALILLGMKHLLDKAGLRMVARPEQAQHILINGGGAMNDIWRAGLDVIARYRRRYPSLPVTVGPSSYRFNGIDFGAICDISTVPLFLFARERISGAIIRQEVPRPHVKVMVSPDLAFELADSDFIRELSSNCNEQHVLIAMRKDIEGATKLLSRTRGTWLPQRLRRPLSRLRDRLTALKSRDVIGAILESAALPRSIPRLYRDVSVSVSFAEFTEAIRNAALIITDRLHIGILGYLLEKRVVLRPGAYHKIRGVYELSMSGPNSRTTLIA